MILFFMWFAGDVATCMYYTGLAPMTKKPVAVAKNLRDRKLQRALMQFFKPENYFEVRKELMQTGRQDPIGNGRDALIPANPPKEALIAKRNRASRELKDPDYYHTVANPAGGEKPGERGAGRPKPTGYRPGRKSQRRPQGKLKGGSGPHIGR